MKLNENYLKVKKIGMGAYADIYSIYLIKN
jgi:hypothetical protein